MSKCQKRTKKLFKFFTVRDKHLFLVTNVFYTLTDFNLIDVVKTCSACGTKEVLSLDKQTLIETSTLFPAAFDSLVREFIQSWETP